MVDIPWLPWGSDDADEQPDDPTELSRRERRKRILEQEQLIDKLDDRIDTHRSNYRAELREGANADPETRRRHATNARMEKFKARVQMLQRLRSIRTLTALEVADGHADVKEMLADVDGVDNPVDAMQIDPEEINTRVGDLQSTLQVDFEELDEVMGAFEVDPGSVGFETTEEEELMERIAAGEVSSDDIDIEEPDAVDDQAGVDADADADGRRDATHAGAGGGPVADGALGGLDTARSGDAGTDSTSDDDGPGRGSR